MITCVYKSNTRAEKGDSGGPVFYWDGSGDDISLSGIQFGKVGNNTYFYSLGSIEYELGSMTTANPDL